MTNQSKALDRVEELIRQAQQEDEENKREEEDMSVEMKAVSDQLEAEEENDDSSEDSDEEGNTKVFYTSKDLIYQPKSDLHSWLEKHGKKKYIDFDKERRKALIDVFDQLDEDGSKSIGVNELEDPLIALGLVQSREQVEQMVAEVNDKDNIEFDAFLQIVKGGKKKDKMKAHMTDPNNDSDIMFNFFRKLANGELQSKERKLPFNLYFGAERRRKLLDAIMVDP